jgi:hypothetical protein
MAHAGVGYFDEELVVVDLGGRDIDDFAFARADHYDLLHDFSL